MRRKQLKIPRSLDLASCPNEEHRSVTRWSPPRTHSRNISVDAFHSTADRYYPNQPGGNHNKNVSHVGEPSCFTPPHDAIDDKSGGFQHSGGVSSSGASSFGADFVLDHIYVGSFSDAMQYRELAVRNIQFILNVAVECDTDPREENLHHTYADLTFRYCKVPFVDGYWCDEICSGHLRTALTFIYRAACANACVLVHCSRGISRSPMVVLGYLVSKYGWNVQRALDHVQSRRENACPALCFILGLEDIFVTPVARAKLWSEVCTLENTPSTPSFHRPLLPIEECSASGSVQEIVRVQAITEYISVAISTPIQHSHPVLT